MDTGLGQKKMDTGGVIALHGIEVSRGEGYSLFHPFHDVPAKHLILVAQRPKNPTPNRYS